AHGLLCKCFGNIGFYSHGYYHMPRSPSLLLAVFNISRRYRPALDRFLANRCNRNNLLPVPYTILEMRSAPGHVIVILLSQRQEGAKIGEGYQSVFLAKIIQESEFRSRVSWGCKVL